jgi:ABC-2 type transport system ATP-binding protein
MSSHNLHEVELICHKVGIIKEGKIVSTETISNLRKKKLYRVTIYFDDIYNSRDFQIEGVTIIQKNSNMIILQIRQDINPIIKKLAKYRIKDLEVARGSLEEVFLEFYKKE